MEHYYSHKGNTTQEGGGKVLELDHSAPKRKRKAKDSEMTSDTRTRRSTGKPHESPFTVSSRRAKSNRPSYKLDGSSPTTSAATLPFEKADRFPTADGDEYKSPSTRGAKRRSSPGDMPGTFPDDHVEEVDDSDNDINGVPHDQWKTVQLTQAGGPQTSKRNNTGRPPTSKRNSTASSSKQKHSGRPPLIAAFTPKPEPPVQARMKSNRQQRIPKSSDSVHSVADDSDEELVEEQARPNIHRNSTAPSVTSGSRSPEKGRRQKVTASRSSASPIKQDDELFNGELPSDKITDFSPSPQDTVGRRAKPAQLVHLVNATKDPLLPQGLKRGRLMQDRNGNVPGTESPTKRATNKSGLIPTSQPPLLAQLASCYAEFQAGFCSIEADRIRLNVSEKQMELFRKNKRSCKISIPSILSLMCCEDGEAPFCKLELRLTPTEQQEFDSTMLNGLKGDADFMLYLFIRRGHEGPCFIKALVDLHRWQGPVQRITSTPVSGMENHVMEMCQTRPLPHEPAHMAGQAAVARRDKAQVKSKTTTTRSRTRADGDDPSQPKLDFFANSKPGSSNTGTRRSSRLCTQALETEDCSDIQISKPPRLDKNDLLFPYPPQGRADLHITRDALYRLQDGEFLNDVFLEFGLKHAIAENRDMCSSVHLFNSFFYERLSRKDPKEKASDVDWPAYDTVKKWTKSAKVFDKQFVIIPINESLHWFLAVIYNPSGCLKNVAAGAEPPTELQDGTVSSSTGDGEDPSKDPLDCMSDDEDVANVESRVKKMGIDPSEMDIDRSSPPPQPIQSQTLEAMGQQWTVPAEVPTSDPSPKPKGTREDYDIVGTPDKTYIMAFDSLGYPHKAVTNNLTRWLRFEARDKLGMDIESSNVLPIDAKVPQQKNFSDCGVFLIHYVKTLLDNPAKVLGFVGKAPTKGAKSQEWVRELDDVWKRKETEDLRAGWIEALNLFTARYNSLQDPNGANAVADALLDSQDSVISSSQPFADDAAAQGNRAVTVEGSELHPPGDNDHTIPNGILSPSPSPLEQHSEHRMVPLNSRNQTPTARQFDGNRASHSLLLSDDSDAEEAEEPPNVGNSPNGNAGDTSNDLSDGRAPLVRDPGPDALLDIDLEPNVTGRTTPVMGSCPDPLQDSETSELEHDGAAATTYYTTGDLESNPVGKATPSRTGVQTFRVAEASAVNEKYSAPSPASPSVSVHTSRANVGRINLPTHSSVGIQTRHKLHPPPLSSSALPISPEIARTRSLRGDDGDQDDLESRNSSPSLGRASSTAHPTDLHFPRSKPAETSQPMRGRRHHEARQKDDSPDLLTSPSQNTRAHAKERDELDDVEDQPGPRMSRKRKDGNKARKSLHQHAPSARGQTSSGKRPRPDGDMETSSSTSSHASAPKKRKEAPPNQNEDTKGGETNPIHIDTSDDSEEEH